MALKNAFAIAASGLLLGLLAFIPTGAQSIGVCYGMLGNNLPPPRRVIRMFRSNQMGSMRLYNPNFHALNALRGTKIKLLLYVANEDLPALASDPSAASKWVRTNILAFPDVFFRCIAVGNEISGPAVLNILPAMQNIYDALTSAGLHNQIKVSTAIQFGVIGTSYPPSSGMFAPAYQSYLGPIVQFLSATSSPLLANVYPYFSYANNIGIVDLDYALFTSPITQEVDGAYQYQNLFDAMVDVLYYALENMGVGNVRVVVSETGWPSAGGIEASVANAQIYNRNLISHVRKGTPKKPGIPLETYMFAMFNENQKPAGVEQNWGLFYPNQTAVYSVRFSRARFNRGHYNRGRFNGGRVKRGLKN